MKERNHQRFTLRELAATAAGHLASADVDQSSGRVSDVPSSRTIRYYASHGLLDAPMDWKGRTAIYGRRHVMQLVAIKRLQARGATLAQIQEKLHGLRPDELAQISKIPREAEEQAAHPPVVRDVPEDVPRPAGRGAFWAERGSRESHESAGSATSTGRPETEEMGAMRLDDDVLLVIEGLARTLDEDDRHALRVAAEPLLHLLRARRIVGQSTDNGEQS